MAVGRDGRLSGPALSAALMRGLVAAGIEVIDVGMVTTPMLYFAASTLCTSGIQVTGSHNPKDYNGFKMVLAGRAIYGDEIQAPAPHDGSRELGAAGRWHRCATWTCWPPTATASWATSSWRARMKIVVDSRQRHGRRLGAGHPARHRLRGDRAVQRGRRQLSQPPSRPEQAREPARPDGRAAKPAMPNWAWPLTATATAWASSPATATTSYPDRQMMLFAQDVLTRVPGGTIVFDVKCSQRLAPAIEAAGGVPLMFKTGHSLIKAKMKEIDSPLGGEMSGHIFFKERWYGFDDGTYAGCRLLEIVSRSPDANAVLDALPTSFSHPRAQRAVRRGRAHPGASCWRRSAAGASAGRGTLASVRPAHAQHHRRPARGLARWLRSDPRLQHHAGAGAAL